MSIKYIFAIKWIHKSILSKLRKSVDAPSSVLRLGLLWFSLSICLKDEWIITVTSLGAMASQIICVSIVSSGGEQRKHQTFALLAFVKEIHRWLMNSPHKGPVTLKMFPFNYVIMWTAGHWYFLQWRCHPCKFQWFGSRALNCAAWLFPV